MDSFFGLDHAAKPDEGMELLTTVYDNAQRIIVESILQDAEIPYLIKERGSGSMMKIIAGYSIFGTDIFVLCEHLDAATELITPPDDGEDAEVMEEEEE